MKKLYNAKEIIEFLDISYPTLYKWMREQELPGMRIGTTLKFNIEEVSEWLKKYKTV
ncbi:MAG: DNA-binding protein [Dehalococcoidia bacterium]|nr:MAG: DNA-binding protein [Dehalococcoidia bacterium]